MTEHPSWQYDEFRQIGRDYGDPAHVEDYDSRHSAYRDIDAECQSTLDSLDLPSDAILIDIGTGTGAFALHASRSCARVYAVDVSGPMLDFAARKAAETGVANITFCHAGFLTYEHQGEPADAIVTSLAFHHLPDFWKGIALGRMNGMLKQGGKLFIRDVVFEQTDIAGNISRWIEHLASNGAPHIGEGIVVHVREEHSTFDWIIEGLLERAGFRILSRQLDGGVMAQYLCTKETEIAGQSRADGTA
ncbi:class I SAM-dependent methyltransferase [Chloroflexota bacterium]